MELFQSLLHFVALWIQTEHTAILSQDEPLTTHLQVVYALHLPTCLLTNLIHTVQVEVRITIQEWFDVDDGDCAVIQHEAYSTVNLTETDVKDTWVSAFVFLFGCVESSNQLHILVVEFELVCLAI